MGKKREHSKSGRYLTKWLTFLSIFLIIGGTFAFGLTMSLAMHFGKGNIDPVWMVGMIPFMCIIATPINLFISKLMYKHLDTLSVNMKAVANGEKGVYIPTADAKAFADLYNDFNKMTAEIESVQMLRTEMIDGLSHELKTPVASINGFAKLLLEENLSAEKRDNYVKIIIKESERLASLAKNSLLLSKIDSQEIVTEKQLYNLTEQIKDCVISLANEWESKNIELSADLIDITYVGNPTLMESLWLNLINNAIKFTPNNGVINITLSDDEESIVFKISDNGVGMSPCTKEHIFERYFQGDVSHASNGHGLGLSIALRIARLCNGNITVDSIEGEGSVFTVNLPKNNSTCVVIATGPIKADN